MFKMDNSTLVSPLCNLSNQNARKPQTSISTPALCLNYPNTGIERLRALNLSDGICCRWQSLSLSSSHTSFLMNVWVYETFRKDKPSLSLFDIICKNNNRVPENIICQRRVPVYAHVGTHCHQAVIFQTSTWQWAITRETKAKDKCHKSVWECQGTIQQHNHNCQSTESDLNAL